MYIIYGLHEAGKPEIIQYVGCTKQTLSARLAKHLRDSRLGRHPAGNWIWRATQSGTSIECRAIQRTKDAQRGAALEKKWIAYYALKGCLLNVTHNPKAPMRNRPQPDAPDLGTEAIKNFLQYLRNLPITIL